MSGSLYSPSIVSESFVPDTLIAGAFPLVTEAGTLISGQNLPRGALVGLITASGKYTLCLNAASDGSQVPYGILADNVNASAGDTAAPVYLTGEFNTAAITFGTGTTAANSKATLRDASIFLKTVLPIS